MAKDKPLSPVDKSHLLYGDKPNPERCDQIADAYAAEQRYCEAADFHDRAGNEKALRKLADLAVSEGDAFLLARIERALDETFEPERWRALADAAQARGKIAHAQTARRNAGDEPDQPGA